MKPHQSELRIYYAHSKILYGTQQEIDEFGFLQNKFSKATIICPHTTVGELNDSNDYLHVVDCCNKIIASELNGFIGLGVFVEIARALSNNITAFVLRRSANGFVLLEVSGIEIVNKNDWKVKYGKIIVNK
jgi:hypothetical protein